MSGPAPATTADVTDAEARDVLRLQAALLLVVADAPDDVALAALCGALGCNVGAVVFCAGRGLDDMLPAVAEIVGDAARTAMTIAARHAAADAGGVH